MLPNATSLRSMCSLLCLALLAAVGSARAADSTSAAPRVAPPPAPAAPASPVQALRNKLSADDFLSAESVLEAHREKVGEDGAYLSGLAWLARGALLTGDPARARALAADVRTRCDARRATGATFAKDGDLAGAFGAAVEVEAQVLARDRGAKSAVAFVRRELAALPTDAPTSLRSRLSKRIDLMEMPGAPAPELEPEDGVPNVLASLRGRPVVLFGFAEWCGDCKAQASTLARVRERWAAKGLEIVPLTRHYEEGDSARAVESARVDSVWKAVYPGAATQPVVTSTESMVRYGVSSTPTYVFVDPKGVVRRYTPTRLTDAEFDRTIAELVGDPVRAPKR